MNSLQFFDRGYVDKGFLKVRKGSVKLSTVNSMRDVRVVPKNFENGKSVCIPEYLQDAVKYNFKELGCKPHHKKVFIRYRVDDLFQVREEYSCNPYVPEPRKITYLFISKINKNDTLLYTDFDTPYLLDGDMEVDIELNLEDLQDYNLYLLAYFQVMPTMDFERCQSGCSSFNYSFKELSTAAITFA